MTRRTVATMADLLASISEADWTATVIQIAHDNHWLVHHCRPARRADGTWSTPIQGDVGFPDLVLVRNGEIIFAELKSENGGLSDEQKLWLAVLEGADMDPQLWRPRDRKLVEEMLR